MRIEDIKEYLDVYHAYKPIFWKERLDKLRKGDLIAPVVVEAHLEKWCPHDCSFCAYRNSGWNNDPNGMRFFTGGWAEGVSEGQTGKPKGKLIKGVSGWSQELIERLPKEMADCGVKAVESTGSGESLAHPNIALWFDKLAENNLDVALVTNAHLLNEKIRSHMKNVAWMRFSMDSCTASVHSKVHGVSDKVFDICLNNIRSSVKEFPKAYLGISFITTKDNFHQIYDSVGFWKNEGLKNIRVSFEYEPTGDCKLTSDQINHAREQINNARKDFQDKNFRVFGQVDRLDTYSRPNTDFNYCGYQMLNWNIGADGLCYPCCIEIYKPNTSFGDLNKQSFSEICFGEKRKEYVNKFNVLKCNSCWLRDKNIAIETLLSPEKRIGHVNFP